MRRAARQALGVLSALALGGCAESGELTDELGAAGVGLNGGGGRSGGGAQGGTRSRGLCEPGQASDCGCPGGETSQQRCNDAGDAYGPCACGAASGGTGGGGGQVCAPGAQINCGCSEGVGTQKCRSDGRGYDACDCPVATGGTGGTGGTACVPGAQITCGCSQGVGTQVCNPDGRGYDACDCPASSGGTGGGGSGGSGGSSGGATRVNVTGTDTCPGGEIPMTASASVFLDGNTQGFSPDAVPSKCSHCGGNDVYFRFVAPRSGTATVTLEPSGFSGALCYSTPSCSEDGPSKCAASMNIGVTVTLGFAVTAAESYALAVDSYSATTTGAYRLSVSVK